MPRKPNPPPPDADQSKRFLDAAKAMEIKPGDKTFLVTVDALLPKGIAVRNKQYKKKRN